MNRYEVENMEHHVELIAAESHGHAAQHVARGLWGKLVTIKPLPANARGRAWFDVIDATGGIIDSLAVREVR